MLKCAACGSLKYRMQKLRKKSPSTYHRTTLSSYIFATKAHIDSWKNLLNSSITSRCPPNTVNFGLLTAETGWRVWGTPANFNGFGVFASLLQRRRSLEANQTLHPCTMFGRLLGWYTVYAFLGSWPLTEFCQVQIHFASKPCVLLYWQHYCTALEQRASTKICGMLQGIKLRNFHRRRHLYSAGRPSRWTSAHILVLYCD